MAIPLLELEGTAEQIKANLPDFDGRRLHIIVLPVETEPAEKRNPEAVAAALSRALGRILDQMLRELPPSAAPSTTQPPHARRNEAR